MNRTCKVDGLTYGVDDEAAEARLRELILYISDRFKDDPTFNNEKLCAVLWQIDSTAYALYGEPVTGCNYVCE